MSSPKRHPKVSIITCTWNGKHLLQTCLDAVKKQTFRDFEMILVDNGSTDGTYDFVKKNYPWVNIIRHPKNLGFAGGNNSALIHAKGTYLALLNNDTQADKNWLKHLVNTLESDESLFGVGSIAYHKYGSKKYWFPGFGTSGFFGQPALDKRIPHTYKGLVDVWGPGGGACILRRPSDTLFDPDYFAYSEDFWNSWRMRLMGYTAVLNPNSRIYHEGEATGKKLRLWKFYYQERNRLLNVFIAYQPLTLIRILPLLFINVIGTLLYDWRHAHARILAHMWLLIHPVVIYKKRLYLQSFRKIPDSKILPYLSGVLYEESLIKNQILRTLVNLANRVQICYCQLVGLRTTEFYKLKNGRMTNLP